MLVCYLHLRRAGSFSKLTFFFQAKVNWYGVNLAGGFSGFVNVSRIDFRDNENKQEVPILDYYLLIVIFDSIIIN